MKKWVLALSLAAIAMTLPACQTLRASQDEVPGLRPAELVSSEVALRNYYSRNTDGMSRRDYRDYIVGTYLNAIDANFDRLLSALEDGERESGFLNDLLLVVLTGATALVDAADVDELATVTAMAVGGRATVDQRLFFNRTLPAVLAAMEADRTIIRADIERKLNLPDSQYSLREAFDDLQRLQRAGRLSRGFARVTAIAEADLAEQRARLDAIATACVDVSTESAGLVSQLRNLLGSDAQRLGYAAEQLGMTVAEGTVPTWDTIAPVAATRLCGDTALRNFILDVKTHFSIS
jgi:hypothetical protein